MSINRFFKEIANKVLHIFIPVRFVHLFVLLALILIFRFAYPYTLSIIEQMGVFVYSMEYIKDLFVFPGHASFIPALFTSQFFYLPWIGSICFSLILWAIYLMTFRLCRAFHGGVSFSIILSFLFIVFLSNAFSPTAEFLINFWALLLNLCSLFLCVSIGQKKRKMNGLFLSAIPIIQFITYWLSGGWFIILSSSFLVYSLVFLHKKPKIICSILILLGYFAFPWLTYYFATPQPALQAWFNYFWWTPVYFFSYRLVGFSWSFFAISQSITLLFFILLPLISNLKLEKIKHFFFKKTKGIESNNALKTASNSKRKVRLLPVFCSFFLLLLVWASLYDKEIEKIGKCFTLAENQQWEELLKNCDSYWELRKSKSMNYSSLNDASMANFTKWALIRTGQLNEKYFNYVSYPSMAPLFTNDLSDPFFMSLFYCDLGLYVESFHNSTLTLSSWIYHSPLLLKTMINSSLGNANYNSIERPIELLRHTWRYHSYADSVQNLISIHKNATCHDFKTSHPNLTSIKDKNHNPFSIENDSLAWYLGRGSYITDNKASKNIASMGDMNLLVRYMEDTSRSLLFDYSMCLALLRKDIPFIVTKIPIYRARNIFHLPVHIEEALLIYIGYGNKDCPYNNSNIKNFKIEGFSLREETINRCDYFMMKLEILKRGGFSQEEMTKEFGDTYWYYFLFAEPAWQAV